MQTKSTPGVNERFRLRRDVERFPHFIAPAGATGTVTDVTHGNVSLRLDEHLSGAEEWDNEVVWDTCAEDFHADCEKVA